MNVWLDRIAKAQVGSGHRPRPAFQVAGFVGYSLAVCVMAGGAVLTGASAAVASVVSAACAAMFFVYAALRKRITGRETHVLFEQLWLSAAVCALTAWILRAPPLLYLDLFAVAISMFLAAGRIGCLMAGCCYGWPAGWGVVYREASGSRAVPNHLLGVRLFPAPLIETAGLAAIAVVGAVSIGRIETGRVFALFLLSYAVLRFGVESMRGDERPSVLGVPVPRYCAALQFAVAIVIADGAGYQSILVAAALLACFVLVAAARWSRNPRRRWLSEDHAAELRTIIGQMPALPASAVPVLRSTACGATLGASPGKEPGSLHISMSGASVTLRDLCQLAALAWGRIIIESAQFSGNGVLQFEMRVPSGETDPQRWKLLYRQAALSVQRSAPRGWDERDEDRSVTAVAARRW